jgi:hypothetical protein
MIRAITLFDKNSLSLIFIIVSLIYILYRIYDYYKNSLRSKIEQRLFRLNVIFNQTEAL